MGGTHSAGRDNDELVDVLIQEKYIATESVEQAFRYVDRGDYISGFPNTQVYGPDQTLRKTDNTYAHLSAPCIYAAVVEALDIRPGNSFLNVGSGTGYLSTVIGYLIGHGALNHGIEVRKQAVEHSYQCLEKYITECIMFDATGLAIPLFVCGNGLDIDTGYRKYDRIYVGAEVPQSHKRIFCSLLANRGKLVMPYMNKLICVTRDDDSFTCKELMSVSFRPLLTPQMIADEVVGDEEAEERDPHIFQISTRIETLQEMCRFEIYQLLGREHLAKVLELPISPILQDFIVYYRDPALPHARVRPVYNEPPPPPRSRIQAILQDPPPRIGEYLGLVERLIAERGRPDGADDSDEDLPADSDDDDMPVMMAANMEDADEDLPNLHEDEVEEAFIESDDSDNSLESAEEMEEEWESGNEDVEEETVQVEEEDEEDDEEGNVMVIEDEAIQHQSDSWTIFGWKRQGKTKQEYERQDGNG